MIIFWVKKEVHPEAWFSWVTNEIYVIYMLPVIQIGSANSRIGADPKENKLALSVFVRYSTST